MSALRPGATVVALAACVGLLSACSQEPSPLDTATSSSLHETVQTVREALDEPDGRAAREALAEFQTDVQQLSDSGRINADDAQVLIAYSQEIDAGIPAAIPGQTSESTAPKLVAPRHLDDVTAPVETTPPDETAPPVPLPTPTPTDDETVDNAPTIDPEPVNPDPDTENPADPEPDNPEPENPAAGDTGIAVDGAGGD